MVRRFILAIAAASLSVPASANDVPEWVREIVTKAVKDELKDPDSAKFRWLPHQPGNSHYCGMVNAKNSYGGYGGFVPFLAVIPSEQIAGARAVVFAIGRDDPRDFDTQFIVEQCAKHGFDLGGAYSE